MEAYLIKERELYETLDYAQWMKEELAGKYSGKTETKGGSGSK